MDSKQIVLPKQLSNGIPLLQVRLHTVCDYGPIAGNNNLQAGVLKGIKMELVEAGVLLTNGKELVLIPMENLKMAVLK